jgi:hypothetical protein
MKKRYLPALLCLALAQPLSAQINESDTLLLQHFTALTGNAQTGNFKAFALRAKLDMALAPSPVWAFKTQNTYRYQSFFGRKVDNEFSSRNFAYAGQHRRLYPFAMAFLSGNFRRKIDFRHFVGAGLTWQALRQRQHTLKLSASGVYESTRFAGSVYNYAEYNGSGEIATWRATFRLFGKHALAARKLRLYYEAYWQPSLEKRNNYRWHTEVGLDLPVWKGLSLNALLLYDHENLTISAVKQNDLIATFGLSYTGQVK